MLNQLPISVHFIVHFYDPDVIFSILLQFYSHSNKLKICRGPINNLLLHEMDCLLLLIHLDCGRGTGLISVRLPFVQMAIYWQDGWLFRSRQMNSHPSSGLLDWLLAQVERGVSSKTPDSIWNVISAPPKRRHLVAPPHFSIYGRPPMRIFINSDLIGFNLITRFALWMMAIVPRWWSVFCLGVAQGGGEHVSYAEIFCESIERIKPSFRDTTVVVTLLLKSCSITMITLFCHFKRNKWKKWFY